MFRFKFIDEGNTAINVKHLVITSKNFAVASFYMPLQPSTYDYSYDTSRPVSVTLTTPTTDYIYVALCIKESEAAGDELTFKAIDADGKVYTGSKAAPNGGFVNGKYYYNSSAITLTHDASQDFNMPTIVWTNPSTPIEPDYKGEYLWASADFDITLSGTSRYYSFYFYYSGTVRLKGINAFYNSTYDRKFLYCDATLTVELLNGSANTIVSTNDDYCINVNTLKLCGNGTLTVTTKDADYNGIRAWNHYAPGKSNYPNTQDNSVDVTSILSADPEQYTVTRSARTDNSDGTYTWTYTVRPLIDLSQLSDNYTAQDGDILTGTMPSGKGVSIASGAAVTLRDVTVNSGIYCNGSATIDLEGANTVGYCGIEIGSGTLTIQGSGSLSATGIGGHPGIGGSSSSCHVVIKGGTIVAQGSASGSSFSGAGIGGYGERFGNITIEGGDVTATGGDNAAGIGGGYDGISSCGNISISGGTVRATGGANAAGIGCGYGSNKTTCGDITISGGTVTATAGTITNSNPFISAIGIAATYYFQIGTVTVTDGIYSVAMTNTNSNAGTSMPSFIYGNPLKIGTNTNVSTNGYVGNNSYGTVNSSWNSSTKTWTLTKTNPNP